MTGILAVMGGVGGVVILLTSIVVIGRGIFRQVSVTEELAAAVTKLTETVSKLQGTLNSHETRIAILEDRLKR